MCDKIFFKLHKVKQKLRENIHARSDNVRDSTDSN